MGGWVGGWVGAQDGGGLAQVGDVPRICCRRPVAACMGCKFGRSPGTTTQHDMGEITGTCLLTVYRGGVSVFAVGRFAEDSSVPYDLFPSSARLSAPMPTQAQGEAAWQGPLFPAPRTSPHAYRWSFTFLPPCALATPPLPVCTLRGMCGGRVCAFLGPVRVQRQGWEIRAYPPRRVHDTHTRQHCPGVPPPSPPPPRGTSSSLIWSLSCCVGGSFPAP